MPGCTLLLSKDSPLRTTPIDAATNQPMYRIETPHNWAKSVTKIRKWDTLAHPPLHWGEDPDSDSGKNQGGSDPERELPETSDEIARIYWKFIPPDKIVFHGKITTQNEFLPTSGRMHGYAIPPHILFGSDLSPLLCIPGVSPLLDRTAFSTGGRWVRRGRITPRYASAYSV